MASPKMFKGLPQTLYGFTAYRLTVLAEIKTTLALNGEVWEDFRKNVISRHGSRKMSAGVDEALSAFNSLSLLADFSNTLKIGPIRFPSFDEIKARRPKASSSAGRIVREMRDDRQTRLPRLE